MATAYSSNLALALPVTGELSGTWGTTVNTQITNMLDEALGYQVVSVTLLGPNTLTIPDGTTGVARSIYIQLNGTGGGTVTVPTAKTKMYFVFNNTASAITFKVTGQTGVSIPAAAKMALFSNGADIFDAENYFSALTLGAALPVASGGTGVTTSTGTTNVVLSNSPTLVTPALGAATGTSLTLTGLASVGTTLGVTGVSTLTGGAVVQGLTVGLGAGAVSTNTAVGVSALAAITSGANNVAVGYQAGFSGNASQNTFVGVYAGVLSTGSNNTAVGYNSLQTQTASSSGAGNTAVGADALQANTTASNNTAVGYQAGFKNSTGELTAIGTIALYENTIGEQNTAVGYVALTKNTTGSYNTGIGRNSIRLNETGSYNTGLGHSSLYNNISASYNTAVGYQAGYTNSTGTGQTFIGQNAGRTSNPSAATGYNTIIGNQAGYYLTTGVDNTFIGSSVGRGAGQNITEGSKNTIIGTFDGNEDSLDIRTADNYVVLSDGAGKRQITMKEGQTLALDSAVPNAGTGITFPATQSASTNANTLDDYEEGTWSAGAITTVNVTGASFSEGRYTKIGNIVHIQGTFTLTVTTANLLTYVSMATPFNQAFTTSGSVMDNTSLVVGSGQIGGAGGVAYAFFAASASLPAGATTWYVNYQYQV